MFLKLHLVSTFVESRRISSLVPLTNSRVSTLRSNKIPTTTATPATMSAKRKLAAKLFPCFSTIKPAKNEPILEPRYTENSIEPTEKALPSAPAISVRADIEAVKNNPNPAPMNTLPSIKPVSLIYCARTIETEPITRSPKPILIVFFLFTLKLIRELKKPAIPLNKP